MLFSRAHFEMFDMINSQTAIINLRVETLQKSILDNNLALNKGFSLLNQIKENADPVNQFIRQPNQRYSFDIRSLPILKASSISTDSCLKERLLGKLDNLNNVAPPKYDTPLNDVTFVN